MKHFEFHQVKMLLSGEKELADQLINITKTAREQESTITEQCKILREMGELYLTDAIETGNGEQFVKASALINAALVRTEDSHYQKILQGLLCDIYHGLVKNIKGANFALSLEEFITKTNDNKDRLHSIRVEIDELCENVKQYFHSYSYSINDRSKSEETFILEVEMLSFSVQTKMSKFVKYLWEQVNGICRVTPPCAYAVIGLGSIARQEITPYSDLEFALLIETGSAEIKEYFKNLVYLFHLHILDLGETPIPTMSIESLNDFLSPEGDRFFDMITPRGFRLDGAMPWACKTPIGRKETPQKEPLDLIKTPEEMAALLREDNVLGQTYHVADILCNSILILGNSRIFNTYIVLSNEIISKINHREKATKSLIEDYNESPDWEVLNFGTYNLDVKKMYYRFPSTFVENLRIYFAPKYQPNSSWKVLDYLLRKKIISWRGAVTLKAHLAMCFSFRVLAYFKNGAQYENFGFKEFGEISLSKKRIDNPLKARSKCRVAYFGNIDIIRRMTLGTHGLRHIIEKRFMVERTKRVKHLRGETFIQPKFSLYYHDLSWYRNRPIFGNLVWARSSKELPANGCGRACGLERLCEFSYIDSEDYPAMLKEIEKILHVKNCRCISLLRNNLIVSKAILLVGYDLLGKVPKEANVFDLIVRYRQQRYKNVRERFYLLLDIGSLVSALSNKNVEMAIIRKIEHFFDDEVTFDEADKNMVSITRYDLDMILYCLYKSTMQYDQGIKLCQAKIDDCEREFGLDGCTSCMAKWYGLLGEIQQLIGDSSEAMDSYEKALDIHLTGLYSCGSRYSDNGVSIAKHYMGGIRYVVLKTAQLYRDHRKLGDAIQILLRTFTKNGKSFDIETENDIEAICLLSVCCMESVLWLQLGNQYFEEMIAIIIDNGNPHHLRPCLIIKLINFINRWIFIQGKLPTSFFIENIYSKNCHENGKTLTKEEFLINIICNLLDDESLQNYFLERKHSIDFTFTQQERRETSVAIWILFVFDMCEYSSHQSFEENFLKPQFVKLRSAFLHQAKIFCRKVVKKIVSENIYRMCLIYIDFHRIRMNLFDYVFLKDHTHLQAAKKMAEETSANLSQYFPECHVALKLIHRQEFVKFENWVKDHSDDYTYYHPNELGLFDSSFIQPEEESSDIETSNIQTLKRA